MPGVSYNILRIADLLKAALPAGWFPGASASQSVDIVLPQVVPLPTGVPLPGSLVVASDDAAPNVNAILCGAAWGLDYIQQLLAYVKASQRISTATGVMLDLIANDFFGAGQFPRTDYDTDAVYRRRIVANIFGTKITREAIEAYLLSCGFLGASLTTFVTSLNTFCSTLPSVAGTTGWWDNAGVPTFTGIASTTPTAFESALTVFALELPNAAPSTGWWLDSGVMVYSGSPSPLQSGVELTLTGFMTAVGTTQPERGWWNNSGVLCCVGAYVDAAFGFPTGYQYIDPTFAEDTHALASLAAPSAGGGYGYGTPGLRYGSLSSPGCVFVVTYGDQPTDAERDTLASLLAAGRLIYLRSGN